MKPDDDEVYVVGGIVAKSLHKGDGPWGSEHQYLIRWEGYGPNDDTWEWTSNVAQNAREMIDEFDKEGRFRENGGVIRLTIRTPFQHSRYRQAPRWEQILD